MNHQRQLGHGGLNSTYNPAHPKGTTLSRETPSCGEDEHPADVDEPPDNKIRFERMPLHQRSTSEALAISSPSFLRTPNASLLTQALHSSPDATSSSETEAPALTSDGGLTTSPNTPSPHLPVSDPQRLPIHDPIDLSLTDSDTHISQPQAASVSPKEKGTKDLEANLKQRRCIKFACGRQTAVESKIEEPEKPRDVVKPADPPKRPCMLRFACPFKPSAEAVRGDQLERKTLQSPPPHGPLSPRSLTSLFLPNRDLRQHRDSASSATTVKENTSPGAKTDNNDGTMKSNPTNKRQKLDNKEATRFHEFGGSFGVEDEWTKEEIEDAKKMTVNDTLRKEMVIRKLGQEAEEEAIEEDAEEEEDEDEDENGIEDPDSEEDFSDGNESDNEEGFAESDEESDGDSEYQFWTPGLTTAATSTDHVEHIRPLTQRMASVSSIESIIDIREKGPRGNHAKQMPRRRSSTKALKMRPGTPDLPDSTDFVCGTLDEDRPLEAAYVSCLEERKRSKHKVIPQDIDPSFPTSDPEMDEEDDDEEDEVVNQSSDEHRWIAGRPDDSESEEVPILKPRLSRRGTKSPMPSPRRMRSPPPLARRATTHKSPPPRRLFGQSPTKKSTPFQIGLRLKSPPSSRMISPAASPRQNSQGTVLPHLAQRPHLTHTASLPRTPNPFWSKQRTRFEDSDEPSDGAARRVVEGHSRGPIDIVKGLEHKRQRRKEKFWRQHCRNAGKEKDRKCQPGKGAERMREVGLEMANKGRGYGNNKAQLVLSI
ncbi:MAG: hypothetical protein Q9195_004467 [Heterodermia aff. obscurata]